MAVMRATMKLADVPPSKVMTKRQFRTRRIMRPMPIGLGCCGEYYDSGLGAISQGASIGISAAATAATFIPVVGPVLGPVIGMFGKIFGGGKSKKQKQAESMQRRTARAAGTMQAVANVLANYPNSVENHIMGKLNQLFTTGGGGDWAVGAPCEAIEAFVSIDPNTFGKKRAIAAMRSYQDGARDFLTTAAAHRCLRGQEWWQAYLAGQFTSIFGPVDAGYQQLLARQAYTGPVIDISGDWNANGVPVKVTQAGANFTVTTQGQSFNGRFIGPGKILVDAGDVEATASASISSIAWDGGITWTRQPVAVATPVAQAAPAPAPAVPVPSGQTTMVTGGPALPPSYMAPTTDGQAAVTPIQASIATGSGLGWLLLGGLFLVPLLLGGKRQPARRRRRPARGTTIIRRY